MSDLEKTLLTEQLHWYKLQRHDFMNHWQVIMGYLQLKQSDKALDYMRNALGGLTVEQQINQLAHPVPTACLLGWSIRMRLEGIDVHLAYPGEMRDETYWREHWREEYSEQFNDFMTECLQEARIKTQKHKDLMVGEINLKNKNGAFQCEFILTCRGIVLTTKMLEL